MAPFTLRTTAARLDCADADSVKMPGAKSSKNNEIRIGGTHRQRFKLSATTCGTLMIFQYIPEITKSQKSQRERKASQSGANSLNVFEGIEDRFAQGGREALSAIEQSGSKSGNALAAKLVQLATSLRRR